MGCQPRSSGGVGGRLPRPHSETPVELLPILTTPCRGRDGGRRRTDRARVSGAHLEDPDSPSRSCREGYGLSWKLARADPSIASLCRRIGSRHHLVLCRCRRAGACRACWTRPRTALTLRSGDGGDLVEIYARGAAGIMHQDYLGQSRTANRAGFNAPTALLARRRPSALFRLQGLFAKSFDTANRHPLSSVLRLQRNE